MLYQRAWCVIRLAVFHLIGCCRVRIINGTRAWIQSNWIRFSSLLFELHWCLSLLDLRLSGKRLFTVASDKRSDVDCFLPLSLCKWWREFYSIASDRDKTWRELLNNTSLTDHNFNFNCLAVKHRIKTINFRLVFIQRYNFSGVSRWWPDGILRFIFGISLINCNLLIFCTEHMSNSLLIWAEFVCLLNTGYFKNGYILYNDFITIYGWNVLYF